MQWKVSDEIVVDHVIRPLARLPPSYRIPLDLNESANGDAPPFDALASYDLVNVLAVLNQVSEPSWPHQHLAALGAEPHLSVDSVGS